MTPASMYPRMRAVAVGRLRVLGVDPTEQILGIAQHSRDAASMDHLLSTLFPREIEQANRRRLEDEKTPAK